MAYDVVLCFTMLYNVRLCFLMLYDVALCSNMFDHVRFCLLSLYMYIYIYTLVWIYSHIKYVLAYIYGKKLEKKQKPIDQINQDVLKSNATLMHLTGRLGLTLLSAVGPCSNAQLQSLWNQMGYGITNCYFSGYFS